MEQKRKTQVKAVRIPEWLLDVAEQSMRSVKASDFSDYIRGLILKHAAKLGTRVPPETHDEWPEWIKVKISDVRYEIDS